jgi:hypothetical protein
MLFVKYNIEESVVNADPETLQKVAGIWWIGWIFVLDGRFQHLL